jgi:hypothetical protein
MPADGIQSIGSRLNPATTQVLPGVGPPDPERLEATSNLYRRYARSVRGEGARQEDTPRGSAPEPFRYPSAAPKLPPSPVPPREIPKLEAPQSPAPPILGQAAEDAEVTRAVREGDDGAKPLLAAEAAAAEGVASPPSHEAPRLAAPTRAALSFAGGQPAPQPDLNPALAGAVVHVEV